jgi:HSP20 family molecular chaperone IbpA
MSVKDTYLTPTPFRTLERLAGEVTRIFDDFGIGRGLGGVPAANDPISWTPRADVTQHGDDLVVRVDLPGMVRTRSRQRD